MLAGGAGTRLFTPERYACELQVRSGGSAMSTIECADFEVPPALPPGPILVEVQAAR